MWVFFPVLNYMQKRAAGDASRDANMDVTLNVSPSVFAVFVAQLSVKHSCEIRAVFVLFLK